MLENIKAAIAKKNSLMEMSELLLGNGPLMESMDDSIILKPYTEAEDEEDLGAAELPTPEDGAEEKPEEGEKPSEEEEAPEGDEADPMAAELPEEGDDEDEEDPAIPTPEDGPVPTEPSVPEGEEPLPLPGNDLPEPVGAQTGEPVNTDDAIMSMELGLGSSTPRDILPVPPANAADAIAGDGDPTLQGVDSGFGGNSMSDVGAMDGAAGVMDTPIDDPMTTTPDAGTIPEQGSITPDTPAEGPAAPAEDLSLESVEDRIKKDVNHEEQVKAKMLEDQKASGKADEQFGENYIFSMDGEPIEESAEDDFLYDAFEESTEPKEETPKKEEKKEEPKTESSDEELLFDPFSEGIELGDDDSGKPEDKKDDQSAPADGGENEVTAAVKDKVDEADGSADGNEPEGDLGGLDFGGGDDLGMGTPVGGGNEATTKTMQMLSKLMGDIAKMQSELAGDLAGQ